MNAWRTALLRTSMVAGAFVVVVLLGLAGNAVFVRQSDPVPPTRIDELVARLNMSPKDEKLLAEIRSQDVWLRQTYVRSERFAQTGYLLLLGGVAVWLLCLKGARGLTPTPPTPDPDAPSRAEVQNVQARQSLTATGVLLGGALLAIAVLSRHDAAHAYMLESRMPRALAANPGAGQAEPEAPGIAMLAPASPAAPPAQTPAGALEGGIAPMPVPEATAIQPLPLPGTLPKPPSESASKPVPPPAKGLIEAIRSEPGTWPYFRGLGAGIAPGAIPIAWNGSTGQGVIWQADIPLPGWGSPVVWGGKVFLSGADANRREVYAYDAENGKLAWTADVPIQNAGAKAYKETGYAPATLAASARHVVAVFANGDVAGFDHSGKRLWARTFGPLDNAYGHSSCPILVDGKVILQIDQGTSPEDGKSRLVALDPDTGKTIWSVARPVSAAWSTPVAAKVGGKTVVVLCANPLVICYDVATGKEIWRAEGMGGEVAPSATFGDGCIFVAQSSAQAMALRANDGKQVWANFELALPDVSSPVYSAGLLFLSAPDGTLTALDAKTGKPAWEHPMGKPSLASLLAGDNGVLVLSKDGTAQLVDAGKSFRILQSTTLGEPIHSSPALVNGRLYLRGEKRLFCLGAK